MKNLGLTIVSFIYMLATQAQEVPSALSIAEAIAYAKQENAALKAKSLAIDVAKSGTAMARARYLPQLYADGNLQRNLIIPITPVPANAFDKTASPGEILPLRFMTQWTGNAGLNASFDIFNPQKLLDTRQAKIQENLNTVEAEIAMQSNDFEVKKSYVSTLIAQEQYRLAVADTLTKAKILHMCIAQFDEGRITQLQLNNVIADKNTSAAFLQEALAIQDQAYATLFYFLGLDPQNATAIQLTDSLPTLFQRYKMDNPIADTENLNTQQKNLQQQLNTLEIERLKKYFLPTIGLRAYYGANYYDNKFEIFKGKNWNGNSFVALNLHFPIFENQDQFKKINQLRLQNQITDLNYKDAQHKNNLDKITASKDAKSYQSKIDAAQANLVLAEQTFKLTQDQFAEGKLLISELYEANYAFQLAKNSYLQAAYQFILAQINVEALSKY